MSIFLNRLIASCAILFFAITPIAQAQTNPSDVTSVAASASDFEGKWDGLWHSMCGTASGHAVAKIDDDDIKVDVTFKGKEYPFNAGVKDFTDGKLQAKGRKIRYTASLTESGVLYLFYERTDRSDDCGLMVFNGSRTSVAASSLSGKWKGAWYSTENGDCAAENGERKGDVAINFVPSADGLVLAHFDVDNTKYPRYSRVFESVDGTLKHERFVAKEEGRDYKFEKENDQFVVVENGNERVVLQFNVPGRDCGYMELTERESGTTVTAE